VLDADAVGDEPVSAGRQVADAMQGLGPDALEIEGDEVGAVAG
jgi:hypothetical protein